MQQKVMHFDGLGQVAAAGLVAFEGVIAFQNPVPVFDGLSCTVVLFTALPCNVEMYIDDMVADEGNEKVLRDPV